VHPCVRGPFQLQGVQAAKHRRLIAEQGSLPWTSAMSGYCGEADLLAPAHESLHFLQGNGAIVVGIHCLEYALVRRLKLLQ
jgi:hypothetical protein